MISVAIVTPRYPPVSDGGGELSAQVLATSLLTYSDDIDDVVVFSFDGKGNEAVNGIEVHRLGTPSTFVTEYLNAAAYPALRGTLDGFDVVHAYNMELHPVIGYLSSREGFPSVATLNSYHYFPKSVINVTPSPLERAYETLGLPTTGRVLRAGVKRIDALVALSQSLREIYYENGFSGSRIEHITNMIDPSFEVPDVDDEHDGFRLLYVGTLTENKGVRYLVEAMSAVPDAVHLRVVGDGERMAALEALAREVGVDSRVEFVGRLPYDDIPAQYATADAFVHPGIWPEPLNRTVLEAMQAGLPIICTDTGGPPEVVPEPELLCRPADTEALATTIRRVVENGTHLSATERQQHVHNTHHPSVVVPQLVGLYRDLAD